MADVVQNILAEVRPYAEIVRLHINDHCRGLEAWQIIFFTFGFTVLGFSIIGFLFQEESLKKRFLKSFFSIVRRIPFVKAKIEAELQGTVESLSDTFNKNIKDGYRETLPQKGIADDEVLKEAVKYKSLAKVDWENGNCSGTVYSGEDRLSELMARIYREFAWTNPLHPDVFPDVRKMEAEVVKMTCNMFRGTSDACGCMTSGGTESIMLACKAYRDMAYEERGVKHAEMVVPITVHAAFDKAAQFFKIKIVHVPVNKETRQVDVRAMRRAINSNTCMLVGSAPSFPHGIMDPIEEIAKLGVRYNIPVHVDSCLGGFLVPFMEKAGFHIQPFDFSLKGVTSISADTHKYGFAPKGSSVIMYSHPQYRRYQFFVQPDWPGGIYASPTFAGSRAGSIIAACWATMLCIGENGYIQSTTKIINTTRKITKAIKQIPGLKVFGNPEVSVVGIGSDDFNIYRLSDALTTKGWNLNALQFPSSLHICVTLLHTKPKVADRFIKDVQDVTREIMKDPKAQCGGQGALYGMAQSIPDRSIIGEITGAFFDAYYSTESVPATNGTKS